MFFLYSFWVKAKEFDVSNYIQFIYYDNEIAIIIAICLFVYSQNICNCENIFIANGPMVVGLIFSACMYFYGVDIHDFFYWAQAYCVLSLTMFNIWISEDFMLCLGLLHLVVLFDLWVLRHSDLVQQMIIALLFFFFLKNLVHHTG